MKCQKCNDDHVIDVMAKCNDLCNISNSMSEYNGYVPSKIGIGKGDYIDFSYCPNCGQIQGDFGQNTIEQIDELFSSGIEEDEIED